MQITPLILLEGKEHQSQFPNQAQVCISPWGGGEKGRNREAARDGVTPGSVPFRSTEQALHASASLGYSRVRPQPLSEAGALLSNKLLCDFALPIRSTLFLFSLAMSIVVTCGDPCPSVGLSMQSTVWGCYSKR